MFLANDHFMTSLGQCILLFGELGRHTIDDCLSLELVPLHWLWFKKPSLYNFLNGMVSVYLWRSDLSLARDPLSLLREHHTL